MTERTHIPSSPACGHWETLLPDGLDGLLSPADEAAFTAHMRACEACTALYEEARKGREWLKFLSPEPEIPKGLFDKILATTGPGHRAGHRAGQGAIAAAGAMSVPYGYVPAWQRPGFMGSVRRWAEPRLMMTAAMAFFSIALTLNLTGVRLSNLHMASLRPTAVRAFMERRLTMASVPIIRYYDHLRFVYEVESRIQELRGQAGGENEDHQQPTQAQPAGAGESNRKDGGSRLNPLRVDPPQRSGKPAPAPAPGAAPGESGAPGIEVEAFLTMTSLKMASLTMTSLIMNGPESAIPRFQACALNMAVPESHMLDAAAPQARVRQAGLEAGLEAEAGLEERSSLWTA